jgi:hypothetical protein
MSATRTTLFAKLFRRTAKTFRRPTPNRVRLGLTALEGRDMPAVTAVLSGGILTVTGTNGNDTIPVIQSGATITAAGKSFATANVTSIVVNGLDGDDRITITSTKPATINGGPGANTYTGTAAADIIVDPVLTCGRAMSKAVMDKYQALGGSGGLLGLPTADETAAPRGGRVAVFQNGYRIYWSEATGAHEVHGAIRIKYDATASLTDAYGRRVLDILGLPTSDEQAAPRGGRVSHFQGGDIYGLPGVGVFAVYGAIKDKYNATAGLTDAYGRRVLDILGLPISDELPTANNGRVSHFQGGDVYANLGVGAYVVYGAIKVKYNAMGGPGGKAGLPTSDELAVPGGRVGRFQGADLYAILNVGVFEVNGSIRVEYNKPDVAGTLGLPITDETTIPGGWYNNFQKGSIYANGAAADHQAHDVLGPIRDRWMALGGAQGLLGFPTTEQFKTEDGSQVSIFENGTISSRADVGVRMGFDRNQVIGALKKSEADGKLDAGEFNYFHSIAVDPQIFIDAPTRNLLYKLIDGDRANATSMVGVDIQVPGVAHYYAVGNLKANDPAWKVDTLEKKWFEGLDRPYTAGGLDKDGNIDGKTSYAYAKVEGDLFGPTGPDVQDMDQGVTGDCYFIAALGAVALKHPDIIRNMFTDNKDGTYTVRFYEDGKPDYVTVDRYVPVNPNGRLEYDGNDRFATLKDTLHPEKQPVWVILAEKAFAQLNQSGRIGRDGTNSYNGIPGSNDGGLDGGFSSGALGYITGWSARSDYQPDNRSELKTSVLRDVGLGRTVVVSITKDANVKELAGNHEYVVLAANANGIVVANPWGHDNTKDAKGNYLNGSYKTYLTWDQFMSNFDLEDSI